MLASVAWACCPDSQWLCACEPDDELEEELDEELLLEELEELELEEELLLDEVEELELEEELDDETSPAPPHEDSTADSSATPAIWRGPAGHLTIGIFMDCSPLAA